MTAALAALLLLAPGAFAVDRTASGRAQLRLGGELYKALKRNEVQVSRRKPSKLRGRQITFPIGAGEFGESGGEARVGLAGGIRFKAGQRRVVVDNLTLDTGRKLLAGRIGGRQLKIAAAKGVSDHPDGFGASFVVRQLRLTPTAAWLLNGKLGLEGVFRADQSLAGATGSAEATWIGVGGGSIRLAANQTTFGKLASLGVAVTPFEAATVLSTNPPAFGFPLLPVGGAVPFDFSSGGMGSEAGLRLIQDGPQPQPTMSLLGIWVNLEAKTLSAEVRVDPPPADGGFYGTTAIATLDTSAAVALKDSGARTSTLLNASATIDSFLAQKLNEAFAAPKGQGQLFHPGEPLGTVDLTVQAQ